MTLKIPFFLKRIYQHIYDYITRAHAPSLKPEPITYKHVITLIADGIAIMGIMFLIEYICWLYEARQYSGLALPPIVIIWLVIKYIEIRREKHGKKNLEK